MKEIVGKYSNYCWVSILSFGVTMYNTLIIFLSINSFCHICQDDLVNTLGETVALGVTGIIMWGSLNLSQSAVS